ncbi:MAG: MgtC/SapB family protein [Clostridiales bacterium]|nr:MgtC/SapB family protein [Clostridiales bacterium]
MDFLITVNEITWHDVLIRIIAALTVGCVIGIEREYKNRPAGMRTHSLVCLGAAIVAVLEGLLITSVGSIGSDDVSISMGRISAQVISGIGFLGAGTIFVAQKKISGLTTAASLWNVACLGLIIGFGYYYLALIIGFFIMIVLTVLQRVIKVNPLKKVEIRFINRAQTLSFINDYLQKNNINVLDVDFHVEHLPGSEGQENIYINLYTLHLPNSLHFADMVNQLSENDSIHTVRTRNV